VYYAIFRLLSANMRFKVGCGNKQKNGLTGHHQSQEVKMGHKSAIMAS
jgi:hypothetical protein